MTEQKSLLETLAPGKRTRLRRLLFEFGPGNGTLMLLPIDQGIEHGPRDFFPNPDSKDPDYQFSLAAEGGYSAIACQIGLADEVLPRLRRQRAADPQGQRQDRHPAVRRRRSRPATPRSRTRSGSAPTRSATRSTSAPRARTRTCCSSSRSARTATASACRWSSGPTRAARRSSEGRPGLLLRDRLRGADGDGDGRRHRQAEHAEDRPRQGQGLPRPLQRGRLHPGGGDQPVRRVGRALARRALGRLQDRRRRPARADERDDGAPAARA